MLWCHYCLYFHWSSVSFAEGDRKESIEVPVLGILRFRAALSSIIDPVCLKSAVLFSFDMYECVLPTQRVL